MKRFGSQGLNENKEKKKTKSERVLSLALYSFKIIHLVNSRQSTLFSTILNLYFWC